jgi:hypothetical protein
MDNLSDYIAKFFDVYRILAPSAKAALEAQIDKSSSDKDQKTKELYRTLLWGAKDNLTVEETIENMRNSIKETS